MANVPTHPLDIGAHIAGTYFGSPFTGTVRSTRWHTRKLDTLCVLVDFDRPTLIGMTDNKELRLSAHLEVRADGNDAWAASRGTDRETRIDGLSEILDGM
jgi:hypothetical protein